MHSKSITVGRRVVMVKVKTKPGQRQPTPAANRSRIMPAVPVLFDRHSVTPRPILLPAPTWNYWKTAALGISLAAAIILVIFLIARSLSTSERPAPRAKQEAFKPPPEINIRPMGYSSSRRSASSTTSPTNNMIPGTNAGALLGNLGEAKISAVRGHDQSVNASGTEAILRATLDENRKLVLPNEVAGNCSIGTSGIKDLSSCLARNGARAE